MAMMLPDEPQKPGGYTNPRGFTPGDPWSYKAGGAQMDPASMMGMMGALKSISGGGYPPPPIQPAEVGGGGLRGGGKTPGRGRNKTLSEQLAEVDAAIADAQQRLYAAMELAVARNNPYAKAQAEMLRQKLLDLEKKRDELLEKIEEQQQKEEERREEERQRKEAGGYGFTGPSSRTQGAGSRSDSLDPMTSRSQGLTSWGAPRTQYMGIGGGANRNPFGGG